MVFITVVGFRRPFLFLCAYIYVDIVSPQRLSYYLLSSIPVSLIFFAASFIGWAINDDKTLSKPSPRQILLILLLLLCGFTTLTAAHPDAALEKWDWVWKAMVFAIFMTGAAKDATEARADAVRAAGDAKEEAIDDADVNADAMSNAQKKAAVDGN